MGKLFQGEKTLKRNKKLTIEHGVICNEDLIILPEVQRKLVIKSVHDDILWSSGYTHTHTHTQKKKKKEG